MSDSEPAALPPGDQPPGASGDVHAPPAPESPATASAKRDTPPKRERSGAEKRKRAKAKAATGEGGTSKAPSAGAVLARELKDIESALHAILVTPAAPMAMAADDWAAHHVEERAGPLAHQIVELAKRNPVFRAQLLKLMTVSENGQLAFAAAAYLVPLLIYYGVLPVPPPVREQLKVPDRAIVREMAGAAYAGAHGEAVRSPDAPPPPGARFTEQPPGTPGSPPATDPAVTGAAARAG